MTRIEDRLRRSLSEEADARSVDVLRLRDELNDRLEARPFRPGRAVAGLAAAVLLVGGTLVGVQVLDGDEGSRDVATGEPVDSKFSCPETRRVDLSGVQDEFLPDLSRRTPAEVAKEYDAPRWEFAESGDTAVLRLGNADGSLGSETRYVRDDGRWRMVAAEICANGTPAAPTSDSLRLGVHVADPWPAKGVLNVGTRDVRALLVDDRPVYDYSGLVTRHRAIYLAPCGGRVCFAVGEPNGGIRPRISTFSGRDAGIIGVDCNFFVPDDLVGRSSPYALVVAWDALGRTTGLTVSGPGGTYHGASFTDPSWGPQQVWVALVPSTSRDVRVLSRLHDAQGVVDTWDAPVSCAP